MSLSQQAWSAKTGSSMRLALHRSGDHNGNAFPISSSSSSASSLSCLGESSPESLRSLSSLNSPGRLHSPSDYDMFEVTLLTTAINSVDQSGDVVATKWLPEEEEGVEGSEKSDLVLVERVQTVTDQSESNDNSVSVYLDANSSQFTPEIWNENITLALSTNSAKSSDSTSDRKRSSTPDSTTEIPDDEEDDEEALFLSIGSDLEMQRTSLTAIVAARWASKEANRENRKRVEGSDLENDDLGKETSHRGDGNVSAFDTGPQDTETQAQVKTSSSVLSNCGGQKVAEIPKGNVPKARPNAIARPIATSQVKTEPNRAGKLDLKNVKSKVGSWATSSATKTANQSKASPVHSRRPAAPVATAAKIQRPPLSPMKVAILRPLRGKARPNSPNPGLTQRTRSTSVSSMGSEEASNAGAPKKVPDKEPARECPRSAEDNGDEELTANNKKVSSRLGNTSTSAAVTAAAAAGRAHAKGTKPPGAQGSPGPRQAHSDGSSLGQAAGQNPPPGSGGSPTRQRPGQGIPKPRFTADRSLGAASSLTSKTSTNQQLAPPTRPAPVTSKLLVKGPSTSLSSSSVGSNANENARSKVPPPSPGASASDERPNKSALPVGSQSTARPPGSSDATKASPMRTRALSLQTRPPNAGLKAPSVSNSSSAKTGPVSQNGAKTPPSAAQSPTKQASQHALQRSGSTRLVRVYGTVDKNKREVQPRAASNSSGGGGGGGQQAASGHSQQQTPSDAVPDVVNAIVPPSRVPPTDVTGSAHSPALGKPRAAPRSSLKAASRLQPSATRTAPSSALAPPPPQEPAVVRQSKEQVEKQNQVIAGLRRLLQQGNRRAEAFALVIQHEHEETLKQKKELAQELSTLRDELVSMSQCCDQLQREKEEALGKLQQQHAEELDQLEDRLRSFYQSEWDKAEQMYQEEADKYREQMEKQVEELRSRQEAERRKQDETHNQNLETLKQQHQAALQELKTMQQTEQENLEKTLKETEASLSEKTTEIDALSEKLNAEEEHRTRILRDKKLKDSRTLYLEQELESLNVVLEMKKDQLHQKEKKLMEMDELMESNRRLEEFLMKAQQENEDYKARLDRHAALSKQMSTEQAILQQTLQKESKANKRLSLENEELLWKLQNGDLLSSPRCLSPTLPLSSPRNSATFTAAASLSPR